MALKVEGLKELEKGLLQLKTSTAKGVARRAMKKAFAPFKTAAINAAPRDSGGLAESIDIGTKLTKNQAKEARGSFDRNSTVVMYAGSNAPHAHLVEFGTGPRYHKKSGKFVGVMPPNGFMRGAWDATRNQVLFRLTEEMKAELLKSIARAERKAAREAAKAGK